MKKINDLIVGEAIQVFEDGELLFLTFRNNGVSICIPNKQWKETAKDLTKLLGLKFNKK